MNEVLKFIHGGGFMMYPLIFASIVLVAVIIERAISLRRSITDGDELLELIKEADRQDPSHKRAIAVCEGTRTPLGRIFARGLRNAHRDVEAIEMAMEQEAANEIPALEANLIVIKTIVNISPLLGLLGTIAGMIRSFRAASEHGLSNPTQILGGIAEALISTATGITLAVIGFIAFNYFSNLVRKINEDLEFYSAELVNYLTGRVD
ncbi:biopolymer transport protein [Chthonomonas calidirosea]|uniref:Biopolymer transport proteins n=1 Tax=Chthonomonas calidirosea (strain DSM 23976 / ICMP 18418 / T49) TaxID=1303518 RepID=S0EWZ8_CHTCT|nr:MotA/TolQ/ExbB proton channel family protein [Chthonomonas calidirosea]CCW36281.1 Biopolymer transport proteins [Chthonomonas calidirosea T49]CEK16729.1 biopolymer transport protein [Chthonomonas calidirosea]CEK16737.1 biopolymer transport protein [Chthonomonas calidirosea]CEK17799.1 biopolymer transport protein [Chthonomonas calidirosea]